MSEKVSSVKTEVTESQHLKEQQFHLSRNYFAHAGDGGLFFAGISFVSRETVIPKMLEELNAPDILISFSPVLAMIGIFLPGLLVVHRIESFYWKKPYIMVTGFLQRLPILIAGLALIYFYKDYPLAVMLIAAFAPFVGGLACGFGFPAWMELVAKTIPANRRASVFALRMIIGSSIGIAAGFAVKAILDAYPGHYGYGILHIIAFALIAFSYMIFSLIKETNLPPVPSEKRQTILESLREVPQLLKTQSQLRKLCISEFFSKGVFIALPFLSIFALRILEVHESYIGYFLIAFTCGKITGNTGAGFLGDKFGAKPGILLSRAAMIMSLGGFILPLWNIYYVYFLFFLLGFARDMGVTSGKTISLEIAPVHKRAKYTTILTTLSIPAMLGAALIGGMLWGLKMGIYPLCIVSIILLFVSLISAALIKEPRKISVK